MSNSHRNISVRLLARRFALFVGAFWLLSTNSGCLGGGVASLYPGNWFASTSNNEFKLKSGGDSMVMGGEGLEKDKGTDDLIYGGDLTEARELYRREQYAKARPIFHAISESKKNTLPVIEEALYYEGDCYRLQGDYRNAAPVYLKLLNNFSTGKYGTFARQRLFDIANYWLDDTRSQMMAYGELKEGKRSYVLPASYVHFDQTKPMLDMEGHACIILDTIHMTDPRGPLSEKCLFYLGSIKFFHEEYAEADHYFHQIKLFHPNGQLLAKALELSIICKQLSTGGSAYDSQKLCEARELIDYALKTLPAQVIAEKQDFLKKRLYAITQQQADKDFNTAEFYRRTGHPTSAYFYYELVRRRYPGTNYEKLARQHMDELRPGLQQSAQEAAAKAAAEPPPRTTPPVVQGQPVETAPMPRPNAPAPYPALPPPSYNPNTRGP